MIRVPSNGVWRRCSTFGCVSLLFFLVLSNPHAQNKTATPQNQQQSSAALRAAQSALESGDAEQAIRILSDYLRSHPEDPSAQLALGEIYERTGQLEKAEPLLAGAAKASHGDPEIRLQWAVVLARLHKYKEAESVLAGLAPPADREARIGFYRLKASVALGLGKATAAASEMEKALALKPDDEALTLATAAAQLQSGNWQRTADLTKPIFEATHAPPAGLMLLEAQLGAHTDFQSTLDSLRANARNTPNELAMRQRLAELLVAHGKFPESVDDFQRAVELSPGRSELLFNLALAQFRAGRLDDALATAGKYRELSDTADFEDLLGDIEEARGDNLGAAKSYQAAVALAPNEEKYRLSLAVELIRHKSFEAAKAVLQQADQLFPNSWQIHYALGMIEYFVGNEDEASRVLLHAAELSPEPPVALKYVGEIQMDRAAGPDAAVTTDLCKYADSHPKEATMQYYCGALLFRRDYAVEDKANLTNILKRLNVAAERLPNDAGPHCQLGRIYRWLEQWPAALRESEICARLDPDSAQAHYRLGQIYHHEGQLEKAKQEMKLFEAASKRVADENARRDETMKTFLYSIQKETPNHN